MAIFKEGAKTRKNILQYLRNLLNEFDWGEESKKPTEIMLGCSRMGQASLQALLVVLSDLFLSAEKGDGMMLEKLREVLVFASITTTLREDSFGNTADFCEALGKVLKVIASLESPEILEEVESNLFGRREEQLRATVSIICCCLELGRNKEKAQEYFSGATRLIEDTIPGR